MIDWFNMINDYHQRLVLNTKGPDWELDTAAVFDREWEYEVGFRSPHFYNGNWIIIGSTSSKEAAYALHNSFVDNFFKNGLPKVLKDIDNGGVYERS